MMTWKNSHDERQGTFSSEQFFKKQNFHYWYKSWYIYNPDYSYKSWWIGWPLCSPKLTVLWCNKNCVIGSYFFEEGGRTVTVNLQCHLLMLQNFLITEVRRKLLAHSGMWFQQDGVAALTTNDLSDGLFEKIISWLSHLAFREYFMASALI